MDKKETQNKHLKIIITTIFLIPLFFVGIQNVQAATYSCNGSGSPLDCPTTGPSPVSFGDLITMSVSAYDEVGNVVSGALYSWVASPVNLGTLSVTTLPLSSTAVLTTGSAVTSGTVTVSVDYGGDILTKVFNISASNTTSASCGDPKLVYGIAGVSKKGANDYQYSTAEVLSTCYVEYKLYGGEGRK